MFRKNPDGSLKLTAENLAGMNLTPNVTALSRTVDASISSSTEITLNTATTFLSVYAIAKDIYLKWGTTDVSASNFDEVVIAGQQKNFIIPDGVTAVNFIEREAGATLIVIEK